ncbi:hypothetical protein [Muricoccus radiodurans]|uniref:hypothetical protein n=1 Tax=Muricoccus radiodurans TaxID=2231721 RepID=UPI003CEB7FA2
MPLSNTQSLLLSQASQHPMGLAKAPDHPPAATRNAVVRSLLKAGLLEELAAPAEHRDLGWRQDEDGTPVAVRITAAGLRAIGVEREGAAAPQGAQEGDGPQGAATSILADQEEPTPATGRCPCVRPPRQC